MNLDLLNITYSEEILIENSKDFTPNDWYHISVYQELSEDFIREFKDEVDWGYVSRYQELSEDFIREFKDRVSWYYISEYQELSIKFIVENRELIEPYWLKDNRYFTQTDKVKLRMLGIL